jgi:hypothetical protein
MLPLLFVLLYHKKEQESSFWEISSSPSFHDPADHGIIVLINPGADDGDMH